MTALFGRDVGTPQKGAASPRVYLTPKEASEICRMSDRVQSYIRKGIEEGAEVLVGGEGHPKGLEAGYFVKPTVFVNVSNDMTIAREEIFGPVLSVIAYDSDEDAIRIANDSNYGLHAAVLGADGSPASVFSTMSGAVRHKLACLIWRLINSRMFASRSNAERPPSTTPMM
jgi:hypothetical protein